MRLLRQEVRPREFHRKAQGVSGRLLSLERSVTVPVSRLWGTLVAPSLWWGPDVVIEARPGGMFLEPWRDATGAVHVTRGRVILADPARRLVLDWADEDWSFVTEVRFELTALGETSRLALTHSGWDGAPDAERATLISAHERGWSFHLDNLKAAAERG
ncbi:SRPBCC domain-containing protein [Frigidibacter sp. RF13]|uniref:SRPBCC family protein n=1 Tax=Frigidibacter sp. RF13 TaxID=2997340 RepID=UPI00226DE708|nr:SRPBCC domain-containing protein [Frigidibacter sp. RF13]MCY1126845.1 SRPBCC domain-containing protein [Frigidibacter sp. RF13]